MFRRSLFCPLLARKMSDSLWRPEAAVPSKVKELLTKKSPINCMLAFMQIVRLLKTQPRTGWIDRGIPLIETESIADHMYRMSIIAMAVPSTKVNIDKCVKIALVHDIAEALVGDITPFGGVTKEEKHRREFETIEYLESLVEGYNSRFAQEMKELWLDYEEIRCLEARYVKDIDKLEMIQQAWDYEQEHGLKYDLSEFYESRSAIKTQEIGDLCDELIRQRQEYIRALKAAVQA
ncbi:putative HD domain-containing protein [Clavispora lusitaniae]|uniref:HD domain-containing protein n=1 Tax=Clavispora lusitaniae TaxID=36911 RepID=A0ACD0WMR4_CLALS|nr:putative HD domain-containing protein [Clavispora lusitaniae]QFZ34258.1 putative HD domain-containing protein [Clavispora lusitaniae]QFZ39942.1 putative HD domain-containing protein [Clavispora lusitaniae]QFZ45624.1 putative HD domain-containing protein [Clavispora lusitaniae]QFZ51288.1 putative HD domain-containing protein [Clavispora lusitaniae]